MRLRRRNLLMRSQHMRRSLFEFAAQVFPFVKQLAVGFLEHNCFLAAANFRTVEGITASGCFLVHGFQECRDSGDGRRVRLKTDELRMMAVAFGFAAEDLLRQQRLAPKRDQALGVEIFRVQSPEPHG
jgi:hypothetical protein